MLHRYRSPNPQSGSCKFRTSDAGRRRRSRCGHVAAAVLASLVLTSGCDLGEPGRPELPPYQRRPDASYRSSDVGGGGYHAPQPGELRFRWESSSELQMPEPKASDCSYFEDTDSIGTRTYWGTPADPVLRVQVRAPGPEILGPGETPFEWSPEPTLSDYGVWLTPFGAEFSWHRPGIYIVSVTRSLTGTETEFVFAKSHLAILVGSGIRHLAEFHRWEVAFPPDTDLAICGPAGDTASDRFAESAQDALGAAKVIRESKISNALTAIAARSEALGRPINLILQGHGSEGTFSFPIDAPSEETLLFTAHPSAETMAFADAIRNTGTRGVSKVGFIACSLARGSEGSAFVDLFATRAGGAGSAYGWDKELANFWGLFNRVLISDHGQRYEGVRRLRSLTVSAGKGGTVLPSGAAVHDWYTNVEIRAMPNPGMRFVRWTTGGAGSPLPPQDVQAAQTYVRTDVDKTVTAVFEPN